jgi:hypothetical protein
MQNIFVYIRALYILILLAGSSVIETGILIGTSTFLVPSILMGLGVAIDVCIATVVQFRDKELSWKSWTFPVTFTHVSFPAVGYFLFYTLDTTFPIAHSFLGVVGFILVALFVYEVICEAAGLIPRFGISHTLSQMIGFAEDDARRVIAILAVSWDALWSGPAKAAQADTGNWTLYEVSLSFVIAGIVVAVMAELSLSIAKRLRKVEFNNPYSLARFNIIGKFLELSVIGGFGILSLWHAVSNSANLYQSISISALILGIAFLSLKKPLKNTQLNEAKIICNS